MFHTEIQIREMIVSDEEHVPDFGVERSSNTHRLETRHTSIILQQSPKFSITQSTNSALPGDRLHDFSGDAIGPIAALTMQLSSDTKLGLRIGTESQTIR